MDLRSGDGPEEYCRQIEAYLCRKNDGHLVRIVGPAFERVCGWSARGIPLTLVFRGIDRYFDRYYSKGPRRRPVRIEFCEADVLDVFDEWRRAVGIADAARQGGADDGGAAADADVSRRHGSLPHHIERVILRLAALRGGGDRSLDEPLDAVICELDALRGRAKSARGELRQALLGRLQSLDAFLMEAVRSRYEAAALAQVEAEAAAELAPFRGRLSTDDYTRALRAAEDRLLRERAGLPVVSYE